MDAARMAHKNLAGIYFASYGNDEDKELKEAHDMVCRWLSKQQ
jgi:hypothetical protein